MGNMTSSIKPGVHNVSKPRQRSNKLLTGHRPQKLEKVGDVVREIFSWTDRQTDGLIRIFHFPTVAE